MNRQKSTTIRLKLDGAPRKRNSGRLSVISDTDVTNLLACFERDYTITQALTEADVPRRSFYRKWRADQEFRHKVRAAKARAMIPIKKNVLKKAAKDPDLGLKVLERREKKDWSPKIDVNMKFEPIRIVFDEPAPFFNPAKAKEEDEEEIVTDDDIFS